MKEQFILDLVKELNEVNNSRINENECNPEAEKLKLLDVCYMVATVAQHIGENKEFIEDITNYNYSIEGFTEDTTGYMLGSKIEIFGDFSYNDSILDYYYEITFKYDERLWRYCECIPDMPTYNKEHECCGNGCDWTAPAFDLKKITNMGNYSWTGCEANYWDFEIKFKNEDKNRNEEAEQLAKQGQIDYYEKEILKLQEKLGELKNNA